MTDLFATRGTGNKASRSPPTPKPRTIMFDSQGRDRNAVGNILADTLLPRGSTYLYCTAPKPKVIRLFYTASEFDGGGRSFMDVRWQSSPSEY